MDPAGDSRPVTLESGPSRYTTSHPPPFFTCPWLQAPSVGDGDGDGVGPGVGVGVGVGDGDGDGDDDDDDDDDDDVDNVDDVDDVDVDVDVDVGVDSRCVCVLEVDERRRLSFAEWQAPSLLGRPPPVASPSAFGLRLGGDW